MQPSAQAWPRVVSPFVFRKWIGFLGVGLPVAMAIGAWIFGDCGEVQESVSAYYYTIMSDVFVGMLFAVAFFLISYRGYDLDALWSSMAGGAAIAVAVCSTNIEDTTSCIASIDTGVFGTIHLVSAALFLVVLAYFSLVLFPKSSRKDPPKQKRRRNKIFRICGWVMLACLVLILLYFLFLDKDDQFDKYHPVFWLEAVALFFFGVSWLTKGQLIYKDKQPTP